MAKGVRLTIIGGGFVAWQFFNFIFSSHFSGSPLGFWAFIGFILLAVGIPKIIASRPPGMAGMAGMAGVASAAPSPAPPQTHSIQQGNPNPAHSAQQGNPNPVFSAPSPTGPPVPQTSELEPVGRQAASVTEDETRHLPHGEPPRELIR
jgi:hypothetical protein